MLALSWTVADFPPYWANANNSPSCGTVDDLECFTLWLSWWHHRQNDACLYDLFFSPLICIIDNKPVTLFNWNISLSGVRGLTQICDVISQLTSISAGEILHRLLTRCTEDVGVDGSWGGPEETSVQERSSRSQSEPRGFTFLGSGLVLLPLRFGLWCRPKKLPDAEQQLRGDRNQTSAHGWSTMGTMRIQDSHQTVRSSSGWSGLDWTGRSACLRRLRTPTCTETRWDLTSERTEPFHDPVLLDDMKNSKYSPFPPGTNIPHVTRVTVRLKCVGLKFKLSH